MAYLTIKNIGNFYYSDWDSEWFLHRILTKNPEYYEFQFFNKKMIGKHTSIKLYRRSNHYYGKNVYRLTDGARYVSADWFTKENATVTFKEILEN
jgi:hypothetical protein